ncbi:hypothetical protein M409DRAFT_26089 [Zasmidium cellare ATCC 36951]|uniref:Cytochrome P450 n=1 Tax=Zasmidium cellare ATCC 36951 TaxID=1080233 RepID=A0A6A6C8G8_ZASCE|nr:uncharacterized protein M409DRAFT_26089 [Zasmidium cellare ATCC 36951]KAF2163477.1 hypothetical protein M409DRAFT_26089 [Zasmidium cellare ATCC 36951]
MALLSLAQGTTSLTLPVVFGSLLIISSVVYYLFYKPPFPPNAPKQTSDRWPLLGSMNFFFRRWDFYQRAFAESSTGNFSFYAGQWPVIALSGERERKIFFEHKGLAFAEGYAALLGGSPEVKPDNNVFAETHGGDSAFSRYFTGRLITLLKGPMLKKGLPQLLLDARASMERLQANSSGITDPFESIYRMVFQFTMRTVAANEIANDAKQLEKCLQLFEAIEGATSSWSIAYPWMPVPSKLQRTYGGAQLYMIFKNIIDDRRKTARREEDALQYLIDNGDSITDILTFVLGSLFAGQLNSGINAAWILCYLANKPHWLTRVRDEVRTVANKYVPDSSLPLREKLMHIPIEAWESEFPTIDICLKDSIRLQTAGTAFRKNMSGQDIPLASGEVIPNGAYVTLAAGEMHLNESIYENPAEWDPARYLPERQEDKRETYAWMGWGVARHPCLGMRFAKLENNIIVAFFTSYFDEVQLCDQVGNVVDRVPRVNFNNHTAHQTDTKIYLKYRAGEKQ